MCNAAIKKRDTGLTMTELDFKFHFAPWFTSKEYRIDPEGVEIPPRLLKYFDYLKEKHSIELDDWQKAWYCKKEEQQKSLMKQEYPSFPEEAFTNSGRPVFDREQVSAAIARAEKVPFIRGNFDSSGAFAADPHGMVKLFKKPDDGRKYANGADVAEGLETGDFSTQFILNKDLEQMASFHGHLHPDLFGAQMISMGKYYNSAVLAPEVNNHGLTTLTHITNKNYPFIFMRKVLDERTNEWTDKAGWQTNIKTKPIMLDELIAAFRDNLITINDIDLLREMLELAYEADGSVNLNGKDRVVSAAIALQAIKQVTEVSLGGFDMGKTKNSFKSFTEMLEYGERNQFEESYFD
jgi:hypothetical protein